MCQTGYVQSRTNEDDDEKHNAFEVLRKKILEVNNSETKEVQVHPLEPSDSIKLEKMFVQSSIVEEIRSDSYKSVDKEIDSEVTEENMFVLGSGKRARYVFMLGEAGYGKTVQCRYIVKQWCEKWTDGSKKDRKTSNTENGLRSFDFLFLVDMHGVTHSDVPDIICETYSRSYNDISSENETDIRNVLKDESQVCLIILDGLDEWGNPRTEKKNKLEFPDCKNMPNCTFLIAMRNWKFMDIEKIYRPYLDKKIRLNGLDDTGITNLTRNMLCNRFNFAIDSPGYKEVYERVVNTASKSSSNVQSLMRIPLLAIICIFTSNENVPTGRYLTGFTCFYLSAIETLMKRFFDNQNVDKETPIYYSDEKTVIGSPDYSMPTLIDTSLIKKFPSVRKMLPELTSLGKLAFEEKLICSEAEFTEQLGRNTLDTFCKIGLIYKRHSKGPVHERHYSISFLHKTIEDFICCLYLMSEGTKENVITHIRSNVTRIEEALQFSTVLTFLSGLSPEVGCALSRHLESLASDDSDICKFREYFSSESNQKVFYLYDLLLGCYREARGGMSMATFKTRGYHFVLSDVIIHGKDKNTLIMRETAEILLVHFNEIKSLQMKCIPDDNQTGISNKEVNDFLNKSNSIVALNIDGFLNGKCRLFEHFYPQKPCLRALGLHNVAFAGNNLVNFLTEASFMENVRALGLFYIKPDNNLNVEFRYAFPPIHEPSCTSSGFIQSRKPSSLPQNKGCSENSIPLLCRFLNLLPKLESISTFHVSYMDSNEDRLMLLEVLPNMRKLTNFAYHGSSILPHHDKAYDDKVMQAIVGIKELQLLFVCQIKSDLTNLNLETKSSLQRIRLQQFEMKNEDWGNFVRSIVDNKLPKLTKIVLNDTNIDQENLSKIERSSITVIRDQSTSWQE